MRIVYLLPVEGPLYGAVVATTFGVTGELSA